MHAKFLAIVIVLLCACGTGGAPPQPTPFPPTPSLMEANPSAILDSMSTAGQDRPAGDAVDRGHLRRLRRPGLRADAGVGGLAPRRRAHRLGRLAARHRGQAQPAAGALAASAAGRLGPGRRAPASASTAARRSPPIWAWAPPAATPHAYEMGRITALEGRAVGIHLAFAPVADVNNNPANPIINTRSFGEDPQAVGRLVAAEVRGLQDHGMLATVKHFPGPRRHRDRLAPRAARDRRRTGRASTRSSWCRSARRSRPASTRSCRRTSRCPAIDAGELRPGTVLPEVLTGILRDSLGFKGLVVTDALNMGGVANAYGAGRGGARLPRRRGPPAPAGGSRGRDRRDGRGGGAGRDHQGAARPLGAPRARDQEDRWGCSAGGPCRSTAFPPSSATPSSRPRPARWRRARS